MKEFFCEHCKQILTLKNGRSFGAHKTNCNLNPNRKQIIKKIVDAITLEKIIITKRCIKCNKTFYVERTIKNGKQQIPKREKECCSQTCANSHIQTDEQNAKRRSKLKLNKKINISTRQPVIKCFCAQCNKEIKKNKSGLCRTCYNLSDLPSKNLKGKSGGVRQGGGHGKCGRYKTIWCDSSWELAYVIYNLEHNIKFERNKQGFEYLFEDKKHKYYPDFILENGTYVEVKGWMTKQNEEKINQFEHELIIIKKKEIKLYLDYAISKYGKDFIYLYNESLA